MAKSKRMVIRVVPYMGSWALVVEASSKQTVVAAARAAAKAAFSRGGLAQVVVHGRTGRIITEFTYGQDPKHRKG